MNRDDFLDQVRDTSIVWDVIVVGGGATGLGTALDSATRGYRTLLLEQFDFGKATSSRSTKLVHGGVRYLRQRELSLVRQALRERERMLLNAPHLVRVQPFVIPAFKWWEKSYYRVGLKLYDLLAGKNSFGRSRGLSRSETLESLPTLKTSHLRGGVEYPDGQFDDARYLIALALSVVDAGGVPINYVRIDDLTKKAGRVTGVLAINAESGETLRLSARVVINATGVFSDTIRQLDNANAAPELAFSQGTHVVLNRSVLPGKHALMVPSTADGRVVFAIPWQDRVLLGTTDVPVKTNEAEPIALPQEVDYLLDHASAYLSRGITRDEVKSVFAGLRPLLRSGKTGRTADLSRSHRVSTSDSGLVSITGGKWTTYRQMAEDAVNLASHVAQLEQKPCVTRDLKLHGWANSEDKRSHLSVYGTDAASIESIEHQAPHLRKTVHPMLPQRLSEVVWAVRGEMARNVEDVLARRSRSLLLDAAASIEAAPVVAKLMAQELGRDDSWANDQVKSFARVAQAYVYTKR